MSREQRDFVKAGSVYAAITFVLSNIIAGDLRSNELHYILGSYPYGGGLLFWPVVGYIYASLKSPFGSNLCLTAILFHNYGLINRALNDDSAFIERAWTHNRPGLTVVAAFYLCGQLLIVGLLLQTMKAKPRD